MIQIYLKIKIRDDATGTEKVHDVRVGEDATIHDFYLENGINTRMSGNFILRDSDHDLINSIGMTSDVEGFIILDDSISSINENPDAIAPSSILQIMVLDWTQVHTSGYDTMLKFNFIGGSFSTEMARSGIYKGSSIEAIEQILAGNGVTYELGSDKLSRLKGEPADKLQMLDVPENTGGWYQLNTGMFNVLDYVTSHSLKLNDALFWACDDITGNYTVSSLGEQYSINDRYVILWTGSDSSNPVVQSEDISETVIIPSNFAIKSEHGKNYDAIFPNVTYTLGFGRDIKTSNVKFGTYLNDMHGRKIEFGGGNSIDFGGVLGIDAPRYGTRTIKQMSSPNTHKLHAFAEDYRAFKYGTFSKKVDVRVESSFGLPIGEYVTFIAHKYNKLRQGIGELDKLHSDRYIVEKKVIRFSGSGADVITEMTLMSDNMGEASSEVIDTYTRLGTVLGGSS